jgi:hypothetical protein
MAFAIGLIGVAWVSGILDQLSAKTKASSTATSVVPPPPPANPTV